MKSDRDNTICDSFSRINCVSSILSPHSFHAGAMYYTYMECNCGISVIFDRKVLCEIMSASRIVRQFADKEDMYVITINITLIAIIFLKDSLG